MKHLEQRRDFLKKAVALGGGVSLLGTPLASQAFFSSNINKSGYKALVCLDLDGGNDGTNMVVATDASGYASYRSLRGSLAISKDRLRPLANTQHGLHPALDGIQRLFNNGSAAILANVGPKVKSNGRVGGTPRFGSHSYQRELWSGINPKHDVTVKNGWMGRLSDLDVALTQGNLSVSGKSLWQRGLYSDTFSLSNTGIRPFRKRSELEMIRETLAQDDTMSDSAFISEYAVNDQQTRSTTDLYDEALNSPAVNQAINSLSVSFPNTYLGNGFETILRTILARDTFAMPRQSFHISLGGFDFHVKLLGRQNSLLSQVNGAVYAFQSALEQLGLDQMVTTFTTSDFGRTTTHNGTGTGHGWGNHHLIIGGAVNGGKIYGRMPKVALSDPDLMGHKGILRPSTSTDQYAATLARWYGVSGAELDIVVPNLKLFGTQDLGFMNS